MPIKRYTCYATALKARSLRTKLICKVADLFCTVDNMMSPKFSNAIGLVKAIFLAVPTFLDPEIPENQPVASPGLGCFCDLIQTVALLLHE